MTVTNSTLTPLPSRDKVLERVRAFVADAADCPVDTVEPDSNLYEAIGIDSLGIDSLGSISIFIDIAYEFNIPEPTDTTELPLLNTPEKLVSWIFLREPERQAHNSSEATISTEQIRTLLPYGDAFRFVDSVVAYGSDSIQTSMLWKKENVLAAAHFADGPHLVPGVLLAEQVAQSALLLAKLTNASIVTKKILLSRLQCEFLSPAHVPVAVIADVVLEKHGNGNFKGVCSSAGIRLAMISGSATIP